jgi:hypothetical protein
MVLYYLLLLMFVDPCIILIHIGNPTRCNSVSKFYFIFIWSSICFGRHTAHHQEPKTALAASGFAYVKGCWTCISWTLTGVELRINFVYKDECLYDCLHLIQIHISEPIGTKLCTHIPRGLAETVVYVWAHNILPFPPFRPILSGAGADSCA